VDDNIDPVLTCPGALVAVCSITEQPPYATYADFVAAGGSATDNCGIDAASFSLVSEVSDGNTCPETVTRTYGIADLCGNTAECTQVITVDDNIDPVLTCPGALVAVCSIAEQPPYVSLADFVAAGGSATDNCGVDASSFILISEVDDGGDCPKTVTRTYQIADLCGNLNTCTQTITINDAIPPDITCPPALTAVCSIGEHPAYATWAEFVAAGGSGTDNCGVDESSFAMVSEVDDGGNCPKTITRTYQIADLCGNLNTCTQTVTINDAILPDITCPGALTAVCSITEQPPYVSLADFVTAGGSATDNCGIDAASFSLVSETSDGNTCPETITRIYQIADLCGNLNTCTQTITVDDNIDPVLTCPGALVAVCSISEQPPYATYADFVAAGGSATDNCGIDAASFSLVSEVSDGNTCPETVTRTYGIADLCGNTAECTQVITVDDNIDPVLTCPGALVAVCSIAEQPPYVSLADFVAAGGSATDNCGVDASSFILISEVDDGGDCPKTVTRTYQIADLCGNLNTCTQTITINDAIPPDITCPPALTAVCSIGEHPAYATWAEFVAAGGSGTDNCGVDESSFAMVSEVDDGGNCPKTITRTYQIADLCGNLNTCTQTVTINDAILPDITCPGALTAVCSITEQPPYVSLADFVTAGGSATDNCGIDAASFSLVSETSDGNTCPETITRIYQIADLCGNLNTCTQTITVDDNIVPQMTCPADTTVSCSADIPSPDILLVGASDNCGVAMVSFVGDVVSGWICENQYTLTRTYMATDNCGNTAICSQVITVFDNIAPDMSCPPEITVACSIDEAPPYLDLDEFITEGGFVSDNCGEIDPVTFRYEEVDLNGNCPDTVIRTYYISDICGNEAGCNQLIIINDEIVPEITCPANVSVNCYYEIPAPATDLASFEVIGGYAYDNCGIASFELSSETEDPGECPKVITRVYSVSDICGNISSCTHLITVNDTITPQITFCPPDVIAYADTDSCGTDVVVEIPTATDNCQIDTIYNSLNGEGDASGYFDVGVYTITWFAVDGCENVDSCVMTVTVIDTVPPVIICPPDTLFYAGIDGCYTDDTIASALASDNCAIDSIWNDYTGNSSGFARWFVGDTTVTWYAVDIYGLLDSCTMQVTVVDTLPPVINCPPDTTFFAFADSCWANGDPGKALATDNCYVDSVWNDYTGTGQSSALWPIGDTYVTWYAVDIYGNMDSCSLTVTVIDTVPPVIICPLDITQPTDSALCEAYVEVPEPEAYDNCALDTVWNNYTFTGNASGIYPVGTTEVWWYAFDVSGNYDSCSMTITVIDTAKVQIVCPPDVLDTNDLGICGAYVNVEQPLIIGNCGSTDYYNSYNLTQDASDNYIVGVTTVWWYALDSLGIVSDSCSMTVTVIDLEPPVVICPPDVTVSAQADTCWAFLDPGLPNVTDNCAVDSVWNSYTGGASAEAWYEAGTTVVWWFGTDIYGNIDSCWMTVTVVDSIPPVIICPDDIVQPTDSASCEAYVIVPEPDAWDNCALDTVYNDYTWTGNASAYYDVGTTVVWWYAFDMSGNSDSCSMTVTVIDTAQVRLICPPDVLDTNDFGICGAYVDVERPEIIGNCGSTDYFNSYNGTQDASDDYIVGVTTVWWYALDSLGLISDSCSMSVTVIDLEPPVIVCPPDVSVSAGADSCWAFVDPGLPDSTDNCAVDSVWNTYTGTGSAAAMYPAGITVVTWIAVDIYGNLDSCDMTVTVIDSIPPTIICPPDVVQPTDPGVCEAFVNVQLPVVWDNCFIDTVYNDYNWTGDASDIYPEGTTIVKWIVYDLAGNADSCYMSVTVFDNEPPQIICPPDTLVSTEPDTCGAWVNVPLTDVFDNCGIDQYWNNYNFTTDASDYYPVGTWVVTWYITDIHGMTDSCSHTVVVVDDLPPVIVCPPDTLIYAQLGECEFELDPGLPVATDNCAIDEVWNSYTGTGSADTTYYTGVTIVTWYATDIYGNIDSCSMSVTILDTIPPQIACPPDTLLYATPDLCGIYTEVGVATAVDNCEIDSIWNDYTGVNSSLATYPVGQIILTWYAVDLSGNIDSCQQVVNVIDTIPPDITCPDDIIVSADPGECSAYVQVPLPPYSDNCAADPPVNDYNWTTNATDTYPVGTWDVWWYVADIYGNEDSCMMTITVIDDQPPLITCPPDDTLYVDSLLCEITTDVGTAIATDNCGIDSIWNDLTGTISSYYTYQLGVTTLIWYATDIHGNSSSCTQVITVLDTIGPVITCPPDTLVISDFDQCGAFIDIPPPGVWDDCIIDSLYNDYTWSSILSANFDVGTTTVRWFVFDASGNFDFCDMTITVVDSIPPLIDCPDDILQVTDPGLCQAYVPVPIPDTSDNCGMESLVNDYTGTADASAIYNVGVTIVTWIATDIYGNTSTCSTTVTVYDPEPPTIVCPEDITVYLTAQECEMYVQIPIPETDDNCGIESLVNDHTGTDDASGMYHVGTTVITWVVTDISGNTASCSTTVTVISIVDAIDDYATTEMNTPVDINVILNDIFCLDILDTNVFNILQATAFGTLSFTNNFGIVTYTPNFGYHGYDMFIYEICDSTGVCDNAIVIINVLEVINHPPVAVDDYEATDFYVPVTIRIMYNDYDPDGDSIFLVSIVTPPGNGQLEVNDDETVTYTPNPGFMGIDVFTYMIRDDGYPILFDTANVYIEVPETPYEEIPFKIYNTLTPNDDGDNDYWKILGIEYFPDNDIILMDRWGKIVHTFKGYNNTTVRWEGYDDTGRKLMNGVYFYILELHNLNKLYKGWVMLHR
jgi:gliding motility-associated-like protein